MPRDDDLISRMLQTISRHSMISTGEKLLVAVSGGPDSVALLHALHVLSDELGISLHAAHLNHSFRGREADSDAEYVRELSAGLGIACTVEKIDVPEVRRHLRLSSEEAARVVRYEFLERVAKELDLDRIALGHTSDDQIETVLLHVLRGCGLDGLAGMPPTRGKIIRPLIETPRAVVEDYVSTQGLNPRMDSSNLSSEYTRNRIRHELLPLLRKDFNPGIDSAVLRLSELARDETAYLDVETQEAFRAAAMDRGEGEIGLDANAVLSQPPAVRRRVIREAVRALKGDVANLSLVHVQELVRLLEAGSRFEYDLPGGGVVEREGAELVLLSSRPSYVPIIYRYEVVVPGRTLVPELGIALEAELSPGPVEPVMPRGSSEVVLDYATLQGKMIVRNWEPGDRIVPLGMTGSRKLQDVFVDRKVSRGDRHRLPVIADEAKVVWVAGAALSELVKVTPATRRFLTLKNVPFSACSGEHGVV